MVNTLCKQGSPSHQSGWCSVVLGPIVGCCWDNNITVIAAASLLTSALTSAAATAAAVEQRTDSKQASGPIRASCPPLKAAIGRSQFGQTAGWQQHTEAAKVAASCCLSSPGTTGRGAIASMQQHPPLLESRGGRLTAGAGLAFARIAAVAIEVVSAGCTVAAHKKPVSVLP